jgi:prefoldin subunit 5
MEQLRYMQKEIEYLNRSISGNREQLEAISNGKATLKTFFMGGTETDKKSRL